MVTIEAKVGNVIPPKRIEVFIRNLDTKKEWYFSSKESFVQKFNLEPGKYGIIVQGQNHPNDTTEVILTGDIKDKKSSGDPIYAIIFEGKV